MPAGATNEAALEVEAPDGRRLTVTRDELGWFVSIQSSPTYSTAVRGRDLRRLLAGATADDQGAPWLDAVVRRAEEALERASATPAEASRASVAEVPEPHGAATVLEPAGVERAPPGSRLGVAVVALGALAGAGIAAAAARALWQGRAAPPRSPSARGPFLRQARGVIEGSRAKGGGMGDKTDRLSGKVKEKAGKATDDPNLETEGRNEQTKGGVKQGAKEMKDAVKKQF